MAGRAVHRGDQRQQVELDRRRHPRHRGRGPAALQSDPPRAERWLRGIELAQGVRDGGSRGWRPHQRQTLPRQALDPTAAAGAP